MKNLKFTIFSIALALIVFTSCTNDESVDVNQPNTEDSESITTALDQLSRQFDMNGNLNADDNPAGNVVFDFCFDFVYPLDLSFNNGTTVTVNGLEDLVQVMLSSTSDLYVNGIAFPFDVEVYDEDDNEIEIETIEDEEDFIDLLEDCDFDDDDDCECFEVYDPVCVEISDPNGVTFTITYPNECYAECDGFDDDDFIEDCQDDYNPNGFDCFEFNFPISVVTEDGAIITINSEEELNTALYDVYVYDFVYPFSVTVFEDEDDDNDDDDDDDDDDEEEIVVINSAEDFEDILEDCYDYDDDEYECEECEDAPIDPVCIQYEEDGVTIVTVFPNMCYAECEGFTLNNVVDCDGNTTCSEEEITELLTECEWYATTSLYPNAVETEFYFESDGTVTVETENIEVTGSWEIVSDPNSDELFIFFNLPEPFSEISNLDWTVAQCSQYYIGLESNNEFLGLESSCD
jgi:hypothetical protein